MPRKKSCTIKSKVSRLKNGESRSYTKGLDNKWRLTGYSCNGKPGKSRKK